MDGTTFTPEFGVRAYAKEMRDCVTTESIFMDSNGAGEFSLRMPPGTITLVIDARGRDNEKREVYVSKMMEMTVKEGEVVDLGLIEDGWKVQRQKR